MDFTRHSQRIAPEQVVALLNDLFTAFDQLAERQGLEKIKTVGDAYMVAGGLPDPRPDHAQAMAEMALAIRGVPGCIQVTARTYQRLRDTYRFQRRGPVDVKGKGEMVTWFLLGSNE